LPYGILYAGSSFTASVVSYSLGVTEWLKETQPQYVIDASNQAEGGAKTWFNLVRLGSYLDADVDVVVIDTANDVTSSITKDAASLEAFIRRVWTYNPAIRIIGVSSPSWNGQDTSNNANAPTPTNLVDLNAAKAIFNYYGVSYAAYLDEVVSLVPGTYDLDDLTDDTVHPNVTGYAIMAGLVQAHLPLLANNLSGALPARLNAATADFEATPTRKNGTAYDSRTGSWTDAGTVTSSASAGATITYSFNGRSFGIYRADSGYLNVETSIDGGAFFVNGLGQNGYDIGTVAAHTVIIKVLTTAKIEEFWAI